MGKHIYVWNGNTLGCEQRLICFRKKKYVLKFVILDIQIKVTYIFVPKKSFQYYTSIFFLLCQCQYVAHFIEFSVLTKMQISAIQNKITDLT